MPPSARPNRERLLRNTKVSLPSAAPRAAEQVRLQPGPWQNARAMRPREFCNLERELVRRMTMRKKRQVAMGPVQLLKLRLLDEVHAADPEPDAFAAAVSRAVVIVSDGGATGPAQAVASDLEMDWQLACTSPGFVAWLRTAAAEAQ
jgi:hypothetical protein